MSNLCTNAISHNDKQIALVKIQIICGYDQQNDQPFIKVIDNGPGIAEAIIEQVFDPFFTTSPKGSGLGLYISKEIIESNRAKIRYARHNESGSCFTIHLLSAI